MSIESILLLLKCAIYNNVNKIFKNQEEMILCLMIMK